jgi:predicted metal-dependent hydrolase
MRPASLAGLPRALRTPSGKDVPLVLRTHARARRISLRVDPATGSAVLTAPSARQFPQAVAFAAERLVWIDTQLARLPEDRPLAPGSVIPVRGVPTVIAARPAKRGVWLEPGPPATLAVGIPATQAENPPPVAARITAFLKEQARADMAASVAHHAAKLGVQIGGITLKDTRSRWGSCTAQGQLSLSWRLIFAPPHVLDYVCAHEVAHRLEMNHSPRFWAEVGRTFPAYAPARAWLKANGARLHAIG